MARNGNFLSILSSVFEQRRAGVVPHDGRSIIEQSGDLMDAKGETSILRLSRSILATYTGLSDADRTAFFDYLCEDLDLSPREVKEYAEIYDDMPSTEALSALLEAAEPKRQTFFRKLNYAEGATAQLVQMRYDLLRDMRQHPEFARVDLDLVHLFASWFNRGFLVLRRIDWSTPADILEKIIAYEAVHEINDWDDLRRRTQPADRRCYAYFHPRMPDDPLIFVEVALCPGIPESIQEVLSDIREAEDPAALDTAVFYSISNCQPGLHGISFGESLIKHVAADLSDEFPQIQTFVTLSPIPRLRRWAKESGGLTDPPDTPEDLRALAAHYLTQVKRADGHPLDPVARFHLSNGAQVHNLLAGADLSENGLGQSWGAMVNYLYDTGALEDRSDAYASERRVFASRAVQSLARQGAGQTTEKGATAQ